MGQTPSSLLWHFKHHGTLPTHMAARSWARLSRLPSTVISDQLSLGNFIVAFVYAGCVCDAKKSLNASTCQVKREKVSALLDQIVQKQLRWSMCFCSLLPPPSPVILGFFDLRVVLEPMSSQFQWEVLAWEKVLPNIWLRLASVILGKAQFDCCFPVDAKILCSFSRPFWRNALGEDCCSEEPEGFYQGALSPLTCFLCLWAHRLFHCMHLRAWYSNTFSLSKKYWNSSDTPVLLLVVAKITWDFVTTSREVWGGEEVEDCCFCVSFLC